VDGGGLFREFLSQLLKAAFDPNRGFFVLTRDQHLYPSPAASHIHINSNQHYFFIGRMLGKGGFLGRAVFCIGIRLQKDVVYLG
jgi:ubiquitin-protein ligase E3 C